MCRHWRQWRRQQLDVRFIKGSTDREQYPQQGVLLTGSRRRLRHTGTKTGTKNCKRAEGSSPIVLETVSQYHSVSSTISCAAA